MKVPLNGDDGKLLKPPRSGPGGHVARPIVPGRLVRANPQVASGGRHTRRRLVTPWDAAAGAASFGIMTTGRIIYRYLTALFVVDVLLQFFLAGEGVFSAGPGTAARDSTALDPHRFNGMIVMLVALLLLIAALVARNGRWKWALALFVLTLLQPVLAIAGAAGGLHVLNAAAILIVGGTLAYRAWRVDRIRPAAPGAGPAAGPAAQPAASSAASSPGAGEQQ
jgi:hypothetical protein